MHAAATAATAENKRYIHLQGKNQLSAQQGVSVKYERYLPQPSREKRLRAVVVAVLCRQPSRRRGCARACVRPTGRRFSDARRATVVIIPPSTNPRYKMNNVYTRVYKLHRLSKSGCGGVNLNIRASPSYVSLRIDACLKKIPHHRCCNKVLDFPCFFLAEPAVRGAPLRFARQPRAAHTKLPVLLNGDFLVYLLAASGAWFLYLLLLTASVLGLA